MKKFIDYVVSVFGVDVNTASTLIITLFVFGVGLLTTWMASFILSLVKSRQYRKCYKLIMSDFAKSCEKQYKNQQLFQTQEGFLEGVPYTLSTVSNYALKQLLSLDVNVFRANFTNGWKCKNAKRISKLFATVEFVKIQNEAQKESFIKLESALKNANALYCKNLNEMRKLHDGIIIKYVGKELVVTDDTAFIRDVNQIYTDWGSAGRKSEVRDTHSELVMPILKLAKSLRPVEGIIGFINHANECNLAYTDFVNIDKRMKAIMLRSSVINKSAYKTSAILLKHF